MAELESMFVEVTYRGGPWDTGTEKLKTDSTEVLSWQVDGRAIVNDAKKTIGGMKPEPDGLTHLYGFVPTDADGNAMGNDPWTGFFGRFAYIGHQEPEPEPRASGAQDGGSA